MSLYVTVVLNDSTAHRVTAHRSDKPGRVIGAVDIDGATTLQSSEPDELRRLAAALIEAADMADALPLSLLLAERDAEASS